MKQSVAIALLAFLSLLSVSADAMNRHVKRESPMELTSAAFSEAMRMPEQFTCEGADVSPPLQWSEPPARTRSFALILDDPDAPRGVFRHWALYDIPGQWRSLESGIEAAAAGPPQARNDFGRIGYGGPCPPRGHGAHRYRFRLFAVDVSDLFVSTHPSIAELEKALKGHVLAEAVLTALYSRD